MSDLDTLFPEPIRVRVGGDEIAVTELTVAQLPHFVRALGPLAGAFGGQAGAIEPQAIASAIAQHLDALPDLVAVVTGRDSDWARKLTASDLMRLIEAVIEANADFFPRLAGTLGHLATGMGRATAGVMPSDGSSPRATG
jgi:hypothetical protein